ncbi:MAG TPA: hypothetical protein VFC71_10665 [Candidatus Polarisedimenticolia bacterium]|nr:hypothetical protein [Candidatus Polarisedimenticolia bacterium]
MISALALARPLVAVAVRGATQIAVTLILIFALSRRCSPPQRPGCQSGAELSHFSETAEPEGSAVFTSRAATPAPGYPPGMAERLSLISLDSAIRLG